MDLATVALLSKVITKRFGSPCRYLRSTLVEQVHKDRVLWAGVVMVFALENHPSACECYAWSTDNLLGTSTPVTVLKQGPVDSAAAAVRTHVLELCEQLAA